MISEIFPTINNFNFIQLMEGTILLKLNLMIIIIKILKLIYLYLLLNNLIKLNLIFLTKKFF